MSFFELYKTYNWDEVKASIAKKTAIDVELALNKNIRTLEDFKALISPAALPYLEQMAQLSKQLTQKRFGKTIQLYIPLYLSNECTNSCVYCGFRYENEIKRLTLNQSQVLKEVEVIKAMGYDNVLLVTGEHHRINGFKYLKEMLQLIKPHFAQVSMEVAPMLEDEYKGLIDEGLNAVYVYQETYNERQYALDHPRGTKANIEYRLNTPDRLGAAGIRKVGVGCLLGLEDWRTDSFFTAMHLQYLEKTWWQTKYSISFPRMRPFTGSGEYDPNCFVTDAELLQVICAYRIFNEEVEIALSTREEPKFRDNVMKLGITSMSAGSKTKPGGYAQNKDDLEQFEISDERSPAQISEMIKSKGYEVVWKDWDECLQSCLSNDNSITKK
jgi:2-iminoacetate synthase